MPEDTAQTGGVLLVVNEASSDPATASSEIASTKKSTRPPRRQVCRFFNTAKGCRAGDACPFLHQAAGRAREQSNGEVVKPASTSSTSKPSPQQTRAQPTRQVDKSKVVARPSIPAATQNPKVFQITQIKTRFKASEATAADSSATLTFSMNPSDPDFPFEIEGGLQCVLSVPSDFPMSKPALRITNKDMERGFQINVERGFDLIWAELKEPTLLKAMNQLDRQLEMILTGKKAQTIKLVVNRGPPSPAPPAIPTPVADPKPSLPSSAPIRPRAPIIPPQRLEQARLKRQAEVQALKHRLGRDPLFSEAANSTIFTVPIEPRKRDSLPTSLKSIKSFRLYVPETYDVDACSIELLGVEGLEASAVERAFARRVEGTREMSLMAHLNWLTQNMHVMAIEKEEDVPAIRPVVVISEAAAPVAESQPEARTARSGQVEEDNSHIKIIPRPPEWTAGADTTGSEDDSLDSSDYTTSQDDSDEDSDGDAEEDTDQATLNPDQTLSIIQEKGIMLSFPSIELHNIELLELTSISLTIKCTRCKEPQDMLNIKATNDTSTSTTTTTTTNTSNTRTIPCKKCTYPLSLTYRRDILHANSTRAGYLDAEGCTVLSLLPSVFTPTCSTCSTPFPSPPGITAVPGDATSMGMGICRECHTKLTFRLPSFKLLLISPGLPTNNSRPWRKSKKHPELPPHGTPLPHNGRCTHYRKSTRWFRFSCCNTLHPCDRCHDERADHVHEFAERMVCGWCAREQVYSPEVCRVCGRSVVSANGRVGKGGGGGGFWEGGKGERERERMRRGERRKYRRVKRKEGNAKEAARR